MTTHKDTKLIPLTQGKFAIVDADDYEELSKYTWHLRKSFGKHFYARTNITHYLEGKRRQKTVYMHRIIINCKSNRSIDHKNGNGLDNRKTNLRDCSHKENMRNKKVYKNNKSGFRGVCYRNDTKKWRAYISINSKKISLGSFNTPEEAYKRYVKEANILYGDFFIDMSSTRI